MNLTKDTLEVIILVASILGMIRMIFRLEAEIYKMIDAVSDKQDLVSKEVFLRLESLSKLIKKDLNHLNFRITNLEANQDKGDIPR